MVANPRERSLINVLRKHTPGMVKTRARALHTSLTSLWAKHHCPVCESRVNAFQRLPVHFTENLEKFAWPHKSADSETCNLHAYSCPSCEASDRDRLYALYLRDYLTSLRAEDPIKILDFAPSPPLSRFILKLRQDSLYRTADLFVEGVDDRVDIMELHPYADNQFDFLICSHVLEHVSDDRKALRELYRILKPGGRGILMVPILLSLAAIDEDPTVLDEGERWRRFGQHDHVRLYSKDGFVERLREPGFVVHEYGKEFFGEDVFTRSGITDQSVLYVVEK